MDVYVQDHEIDRVKKRNAVLDEDIGQARATHAKLEKDCAALQLQIRRKKESLKDSEAGIAAAREELSHLNAVIVEAQKVVTLQI